VTDPESPHEFMPAPQAALLQAAYGAQTAQLLYVAAKLGIADQLQHSHYTAVELAQTLGVNAPALQRLLRGLNQNTRHWDTHAASCEISVGADCVARRVSTAAVTSGV
jgi:tartrate dehydratase alpha subunit/fumarate hydratase class I-like protein